MMDSKTTGEKLQILLPHWIEHNRNHETEFRKWADLVRAEGRAELAAFLDKAVSSMAETDGILKKALEMLGGAGDAAHGHHHHYD